MTCQHDVFEDYAYSTSGRLIVPERIAKRQQKRPIAIDLFCGAGGFSLGFMQAGFEVVAGLDYDYWCMRTYLCNLGSHPVKIHFIDPADRAKVNGKMEKEIEESAKENNGISQFQVSGSGWISHHPDVPGVSHYFYGDVRNITGQEMLDAMGLEKGDVDCVMGGPPCQGFSVAGKQDVMDPRNSLVFEFARLILEIDPKTYVMENVPGIINMVTPEGLSVVDAFCRILTDGGFGTFETLKKGLLANAGCGGAMRSRKKGKEKEEKEDGQMSFF